MALPEVRLRFPARWLAFGWAGLCAVISVRSASAQGTFSTILTNGPTAKRLNLVLLAEGYTAAQQATFRTDATNVVNNLLNVPPYRSYRRYFNAFAIFVPSNQTGSDHPSQSYYRDTYFNSTYESYGVSDLVTIPPNDRDSDYSHGQGRVDALLQAQMPQYDLAILVVNDLSYGGSGGQIIVTSKSSASSKIVVHESGHTLAKLGDEYSDSFPAFSGPEEPNTTQERRRDFIKWKAWIAPATPLPTPATSAYASAVGLFEGAHYQATNWYRPKLDCMMRTVGVPFCEVCSEALVKSIYQHVRPVESYSPGVTNLAITNRQTLTFGLTPLQPNDHPLTVRWLTNGVTVGGATGASLNLYPLALSNGIHQVRAMVQDDTVLVRNDPSGLLGQTVNWVVQVNLAPAWAKLAPPLRLRDGRFQVSLTGQAPGGFLLQGSTNLATWTTLASNVLSSGTFEFIDPATNYRGRSYRAVLPP